MKEILVSWSTAFDTLMHYEGDFREQFPDGDIQRGLNMSLMCEKHEKFIWWTGLNMAYNLSLLWENSILLSAAGIDFTEDAVIDERINMKYFHRDRKRVTAGSIILSDSNAHKITIFHPGSMLEADQTHVSYVTESIWIAIVSANHTSAMLNHARELYAKNTPFFVDPAQQITAMSEDELREFLNLWTYLIANQHEMKELQLKTGFSDEQLWDMFEKIIITYSAHGSELREGNHILHIPAIKIEDIEDETGAWDAYRAWLLKWIIEWYDWKTACQVWTVLASYCVQVEWAQNHHASLWNISQDMQTHFWVEIDLHAKRKY